MVSSELTIAALYEGEPAEVFQEAAEDAYRSLRVAIVDALLLENERHAITVHLQEQDPRGALLIYLLPLLDALRSRGWRASFHVPDDRDKAEVAWPSERIWGPPRTAAWLKERLLADLQPDAPARKFRDVLMCLEGRHAGALLQHQLGLFRFEHGWVHERKQTQDCRPAHLQVRFVVPRATITAKEWATEQLTTLPKPLRRAELDATPKRAHFNEDGSVGGTLFPSRIDLSPAELWSRLEEVMFTPLVERAFTGEDEAPTS